MADIKSVVLKTSNAGYCFDQGGNFNLSKQVPANANPGTVVGCKAMLAEYTNMDNTLKINQFDSTCNVTNSKTISGLEIPTVTNVYTEIGDVISNMVEATFKRSEGSEPGLGLLDDLLPANIELDLSVDGTVDLGVCLEPLPPLMVV